MAQPYMFEKPLGLRDTLPEMQRAQTELEKKFHEELQCWGYDFLQTPALEYAETIGKVSPIDDGRLFKFLDTEGHPVVLRPDMTTALARIVASGLRDAPLPLRLAYTAPLYRSQQREGGHPSEFEQTGAELIGDPTSYADAEVISLMITLLEKTGLKPVRLAVGHVGFVDAFLYEVSGKREIAERLKHLLYVKNDVGFRNYAAALPLPQAAVRRLLAFIDSRQLDNCATLDFLAEVAADAPLTRPCLQQITELMDLLRLSRVNEKIDLDVTLMPHLSYYTGFVFQGFGGSLGFPLGSGGRYDHLLAKFNRPCPATGFGIRLDRLLRAVYDHIALPEDRKQAIVYDRKNISRAMTAAAAAREKGEAVVMQHIKGIEDRSAFEKQFCDVHYFLDGER
ncbi:MAG: ATP phosphoribosyltransferase regulatory subunit [Sporolactobacillus sp.]